MRNDYFLFDYQIRKVCAQDEPGRVVGTVQDVVQGAYSAWNPSESRGSSFISKKRQVSLRISRLHIGHHLFAPYLLFLMDFSQVCYHWKAIFKENPTPYVTKGRDYFLWKTSAITEIAPPGSSWSYLVNIQSGLILSGDRKSTRLNSSHANISYAVFCLKKKTRNNNISI